MFNIDMELVGDVCFMIAVLGAIMMVGAVMLIGTMAAVAPWIVIMLTSVLAMVYAYYPVMFVNN